MPDPFTVPSWTPTYPDPAQMRREIDAMLEAYLAALSEVLPTEALLGAYFKGSGFKHWHGPLDYVPELSDVDIHLLFAEPFRQVLTDLDTAIRVQGAAETHFRKAIPDPLHWPRPQLTNANDLWKQEDYVATPAGTVSVLFGPPYPAFPDDPEWVCAEDRQRLLDNTGLDMASVIVDRPGPYMTVAQQRFSWRVSPTAARVASVRSGEPERAWSSNRSELMSWLVELGERALAEDITDYYLQAWQFFLSGYHDGDAGRSALLTAARLLERGAAIARSA